MQLKEASIKIPRAIGVGLIIYFALVVPGREISQSVNTATPVKVVEPEVPVPPVYMPEVNHEQN